MPAGLEVLPCRIWVAPPETGYPLDLWDGQSLPLSASHLFARAYVRGAFLPCSKKREKNLDTFWQPGHTCIFFCWIACLDRN